MICYTHRDKQAVALCKNCYKAVCEECAIPDDNGFTCSEKCHQEIIVYAQMMQKSKMIYGLQAGRFPTTTILLLVVGVAFGLWGLLSVLGGDGFGFFTLVVGIIFTAVGILSYLNMKKSGIKS
jgi:predicted nucleic acid-binding Zn ribbon protein